MHQPMPLFLSVTTTLKVADSNGRLLRSEELPAGADLHDRLRLAHRNYQLQGWTVDPLLPGRWSFIAAKAGQRLLIGIGRPGAGAWEVSKRLDIQHRRHTDGIRRTASELVTPPE